MIYVENAGDFTVPLNAVTAVESEKVVLNCGKLEHRLSWTDPEWSQQTGEQWYYVRVIQEDDEMAWSSPMWVTPAVTESAKR